MDTQMARQIFFLFRNLVELEGLTTLLSTHDSLIDGYADLVYTLEDGKLVQELEAQCARPDVLVIVLVEEHHETR